MQEFIESVDLDDVKQARDEDNKNMDEFVAEREKEIAEAYREYYSALEQYDDVRALLPSCTHLCFMQRAMPGTSNDNSAGQSHCPCLSAATCRTCWALMTGT